MVGFKNRYMVMEVFLDPNRDHVGNDPIIITQFNVSKAIKDSIQVNFGECGMASSLGSFQVKYVNPITNLCIIRISREEHQKVWSAITMVRSIGNYPVIFNLLDLSGGTFNKDWELNNGPLIESSFRNHLPIMLWTVNQIFGYWTKEIVE
ncbi:Ribonuclease P/MRP protein subunit POP5 [Quillaja saponaria]|uniref:Ribonuclease P/MRP protein subunit POP5 n=1 Tax=Quillaja saponaria TaxID=32244 RepID=A0AAD7LJT8_QUISA|nr:Ribonuclease P/MRP protein subunit POP5 [Quillaja saponaria]